MKNRKSILCGIITGLVVILMISCSKTAEIDVNRVKTMLEDTSSLTEEDNDYLIEQFAAMTEKFSSMSEDERNNIRTSMDDENSFGIAYLALSMYLGAGAELEGTQSPFTTEQKEKIRKIGEEIDI